MLNLKQLTALIVLILGTYIGNAQLGFSHEIGAIIGPVEFRSDYGVRNSPETNFGNSGIGIGIVHYINFSYRADCNCYTTDNFFNDHFKLRSEISWNTTQLNHFGEFVDESNTGENAERLRRHSGRATNFDIGMQLEYFPLSIREFQAFAYRFAPFISLGAHFTSYNPKAETTYGDGNILNSNNFYSFWEPGSVNPQSGSTWSAVASIGVRYKLNVLSDLMLDLRWQYFGSDWIDGLNHQLSFNKYNDWLIWLNFGYIYYLD